MVLVETGRQPIDNPDTHLELTMIHEGPLLEYAGRDLAYLQWAAAARHWLMLVLAAALFLPHPRGFAGGLAALAAGVPVLCVGLAITETAQAKMRILRVPVAARARQRRGARRHRRLDRRRRRMSSALVAAMLAARPGGDRRAPALGRDRAHRRAVARARASARSASRRGARATTSSRASS